MAISDLKNVLNIFGGSDISEEQQNDLFKEVLVMTLARAADADINIQTVEVDRIREIIKEHTGEDVSGADIRVAARAELYAEATLRKYLASVRRKMKPQHRADTARALADETHERDISVMDYGCGTGLVGEALAQQGFATVDGIDVSEGMLEQARQKQVYRNLFCADLTARIPLDDAIYDAATCIGSMGAGHVGAQHVPELMRPLKAGALFVIILNGMYYISGGFEQAFRQLESDGLWRIQRLEEFNYMTELNRPGWLLVASKQS